MFESKTKLKLDLAVCQLAEANARIDHLNHVSLVSGLTEASIMSNNKSLISNLMKQQSNLNEKIEEQRDTIQDLRFKLDMYQMCNSEEPCKHSWKVMWRKEDNTFRDATRYKCTKCGLIKW